ncbi:hypothetical protein ACFQ3J_00445 [Paenibacillus provencensis]|uniref:Copper amine oxidase N-terminal domain-containing protein n=1 Tax=Paenibacillus provencensis TaxID=441151 RepID=A0ABW3PPM3_9BACL|nr:hypothetical protein [Paenibacillus sp. MER 78]MCM3130937.1 hypothetical protein [Paenibacillus sp. MER 78]
MMKKAVAGFIAGAVMMVSLQAFGAGVSLIGKKIDGQADLKINGEVVGQTIIVQGKSYAPVREITNGVGGTVTYNKSGGAVEMSVADIAQAEQEQLKIEEQITNLKNNIVNQKGTIENTKSELTNLSKQAEELKVKADADKSEVGLARTQYGIILKVVQETTERLSTQEKELSDLESQLAALEG